MFILNNQNILLDSCGGGGSGCSSSSSTTNSNTDTPTPIELHACAGLNACKGHDRFGTNDCAGTGKCATQMHVCHTLNNCRGQGGCGLYGDPEEQCKPAENNCSWQGSCATPIQRERISTAGPNAGKSTWLLARKLFEERMSKSKRVIGDSPFPVGPPQAWLTSVAANGEYDSCGNAGNKYCSFGYNNPETPIKEMVDRSLAELPETLKACACTDAIEDQESKAQ